MKIPDASARAAPMELNPCTSEFYEQAALAKLNKLTFVRKGYDDSLQNQSIDAGWKTGVTVSPTFQSA